MLYMNYIERVGRKSEVYLRFTIENILSDSGGTIWRAASSPPITATHSKQNTKLSQTLLNPYFINKIFCQKIIRNHQAVVK